MKAEDLAELKRHIEKLRNGEQTSFRSSGNSMTPKIKSGQECTYEPVSEDDVQKGDMVFCKVQRSMFTHLVTGVRTTKDKEFQISNNHGHVNGWVRINNI